MNIAKESSSPQSPSAYKLSQNIVPVWQPVGYSTYQITNAISKKFRTKATHTGVLDPLAEGVVLVLLGDERFKKDMHTEWLKEYEFEMTFGVSTDSFDAMGLVKETNFENKVDVALLAQKLQRFIGAYTQRVPLYSAQKVGGMKLFMYPKTGQVPDEIPEKTGFIYKLEIIESSNISLHAKVKEIISKVELIKQGEFRQSDIIANWKNFIQIYPDKEVVTVKLKVLMTRGLYVRSLCMDIASRLNNYAFVTELIRTKNGPYTKEECNTLISLFGEKFNPDMLTSKYASMIKL